MLGLDLPTFVFQIVNFLVLVAILARFFYRPLMDAVARRETMIAGQLQEATRKTDEAQAAREELAAERHKAEEQTNALLADARAEAARQSDDAIRAAREEAAAIIQAARDAAEHESQLALRNVEDRLLKTAVGLAEAVLANAADESLDEALLKHILSEWPHTIAPQQGAALAEAANGAVLVTVDVARQPTSPQEQLLSEIITRSRLGSGPAPRVAYEVHPEIIAGCRIHAGDVVIDLSLKRLLTELRETASQAGR